MKKVNLLSRAEMRNVVGGNEPIKCVYSVCEFAGPGGVNLIGTCDSTINGRECRCIALNADGSPYQSVPVGGCYAE